jgi:hypothetical protein
MSESAAQGTIATNGQRSDPGTRVSFSDVARAHFEWDARTDGTDEGARREFERKLRLFEVASRSELVEAYWCRKRASAVALAQIAEEPGTSLRQRLRRFIRGAQVPEFRLYRETDWLTGGFTKLADLLHECDVLAVKAIYGLESFQQALVMQWLLRVEAHVLGYIEWRHVFDAASGGSPKSPGTSPSGSTNADAQTQRVEKLREQEERKQRKAAAQQLDAFYRRMMRELNKIEDYYQQAGEKRARLHYVEGMIVAGMAAVAVAAVASAAILSIFGLLDLHQPGVRRFYACMGAGAIGAVVSVLIRMSGRGGGFTIDHELGSVGVRRLGAFRPLIGAVSGVIVSFLVQTSLVPIDKQSLSIEFYVVVAFLAGFSERWTKVVLAGAMRTIERPGDDQESGATAPALTHDSGTPDRTDRGASA